MLTNSLTEPEPTGTPENVGRTNMILVGVGSASVILGIIAITIG